MLTDGTGEPTRWVPSPRAVISCQPMRLAAYPSANATSARAVRSTGAARSHSSRDVGSPAAPGR